MRGIFLRNGIYYARYKVGGKRYRVSLGTGDPVQAQRERDERVARERRSHAAFPMPIRPRLRPRATEGERTLEDVFDAWHAAKSAEHRSHPRTVRSYKYAARAMTAAWGDRPVGEGIRSADVEAWKAKELGRGLAPRTVNESLVRLGSALRWARRAGLYPHPLPEIVALKQMRKSVPKVLAGGEVERLLAGAVGYWRRVAPFVQLARWAGLRREEIRWLTWDDVDLGTGWLYVRSKPGYEPKAGERAIPLDQEGVEFLKLWREECARRRLAVEGSAWLAPYWSVAHGAGVDGQQWTPNGLGKAILSLFVECGIKRPVGAVHTLHLLRATWATGLLQSGVDLRTICELAGWADLKTAAKYLEATSETKRRAIAGQRG